MAASRLPGRTRAVPNRRRNAARGDYISCTGEHDTRWIGVANPQNLTRPRHGALCGRLYRDGAVERHPRNKGKNSHRDLPESAGTGTLAGKDFDNAHLRWRGLSWAEYP